MNSWRVVHATLATQIQFEQESANPNAISFLVFYFLCSIDVVIASGLALGLAGSSPPASCRVCERLASLMSCVRAVSQPHVVCASG